MQHTHTKLLLLLAGLCLPLKMVYSQKTPEKISEEAYVQRVDDLKLKDHFKPIMLGDVIEQGLRKNHDQLIRNKQQVLLGLGWDDTHQSFWYPSLNLKLTTNTYRVGELLGGDQGGATTSSMPSGSFGFETEDYTVFNWGKDYLNYLNAKKTYQRGKKQLHEKRRVLKHDLIIKFFENYNYKKIEDVLKSQLRHASFIYRLNREKVAVGKISKQQFYQARSEYLQAQNDYQAAKVDAQLADEELAYIMSDPVGTRYIYRENLKYEPLRLKYKESNELVTNRNPSVLYSIALVENTRRSYELQRRENLPLPKFSVNLGAYTHKFGQAQAETSYETNNGNKNIELVASINATWSIFGSGGFMNGRKTQSALLNQHIALKMLTQSKHQAHSGIRKQYRKILVYQKQIEILKPTIVTFQKTFDTTLENYISKKARFPDFTMALENLTNSKVELIQKKLLHLKAKIELAQIIGLGDLPGESFEKLASFNEGDILNE